jgi:hypothetical protein
MNGSWQAAQKPAHAIGTFSRRQKIDAHGVAFANAAPQKNRHGGPRHAAGANAFDPVIGAGYQTPCSWPFNVDPRP